MKNLGIELVEETSDSVVIKVQAGENWHDLVLWAVSYTHLTLPTNREV